MEGSSTRKFPRTELDRPIELEIGERTLQIINDAGNNLSSDGVFVRRADLPVGARVRVRIVGRQIFEAQGHVRSCEPHGGGAGISFTSLSGISREALDNLIEDLTLRGCPAA